MEALKEILDENNKKYCFNISLTNDIEINTAPKTCLHPHERKISNFEMMLSSIAKVLFEGDQVNISVKNNASVRNGYHSPD